MQAGQEALVAPLRWLRVEGGCMRPLLRHGDLAAVATPPPGGPRPGDIVLYDLDGKKLMHRVWRRAAGKLWIKDDAGLVGLHAVSEDRVKAVLVSKGPLARGWPGLAFGMLCTAVFFAGRGAKLRARGLWHR